jgi:hypothetical protein
MVALFCIISGGMTITQGNIPSDLLVEFTSSSGANGLSQIGIGLALASFGKNEYYRKYSDLSE